MMMAKDECEKTQDLSRMRCETASSVKECALRARSTHGVHHAIVEVNIVIGVVLGEVHVARVVPLVVDAVIGLTLSLIAHVVIVVFVVAILHRISCMGYILYTVSQDLRFCVVVGGGARAKDGVGNSGVSKEKLRGCRGEMGFVRVADGALDVESLSARVAELNE